MTTFSGSRRLLRGGIVLIDPAKGAVQRVIVMQYNPDSRSRTLQVPGVGAESGDLSEALRLKGPPVESNIFQCLGHNQIEATRTV